MSLPVDGLECGAGVSAQVIAHILVVFLGHVLPVDGYDDVALPQPCLCGWHVLVGLVYAHAAELEVVSYERANASVFTGEHHLHVLALVGRIILRVGVEASQQGVYASAYGDVGVKRVDIHHVKVLVDGIEKVEVLGHLEIVLVIVLRVAKQAREEAEQQQICFFHL